MLSERVRPSMALQISARSFKHFYGEVETVIRMILTYRPVTWKQRLQYLHRLESDNVCFDLLFRRHTWKTGCWLSPRVTGLAQIGTCGAARRILAGSESCNHTSF